MRKEREKKGIKLQFENLGTFCSDNKISIYITSIVLLMAYGMKLFHITISHDTEAIISVPDSLYNSWITLGRYGAVFIKKILGVEVFNPYIASVFMFVMMIGNVVIWEYLFYVLIKDKERFNKTSFIFPIFFFVSPIMVEQLSFTLQAFEVTLAILMVGLSILLFWMGMAQKRIILYVLSIVLTIVSFSIYQSMLPLYITGVAATFIIYYMRQEEYWSVVIKFVVAFVTSFLGYLLLDKIVLKALGMGTSAYINDQRIWGKESVRTCLYNILRHVKHVVIGKGFYYSSFYLIGALAVLALLIFILSKNYKNKILFFLAIVVFLAGPFLLTIYMGQAPLWRTQIILGFVYSIIFQGIFYVIITYSQVNRLYSLLKYGCLALLIIAGVNQVEKAGNMFYMEYVQYTEDVRLATKISDRIDRLGQGENPQLPVVFIGSRQPYLNKSAMQPQELLGYSFYQISFDTKQGSWVMNNFMNTLGYSYLIPSVQDCEKAEKIATDMPVWPNEGAVLEQDGIIIVKLS